MSKYRVITVALSSFIVAACVAPAATFAVDASGSIKVTKRKRVANEAGKLRVVTEAERWNPKQTAVIVCDMWDAHHCLNAVRRVKEMAPRMNNVLTWARNKGALIIHAPSGCMKTYEGRPARQRAKDAPTAPDLPKDIGRWCNWKDATEQKQGYPIDHSQGGEDDEPDEHARWAEQLKAMGRNPRSPWIKEIDTLEIDNDKDIISDSGVEIWNVMAQRGIKNVVLVGVHTNMCVLGRPFGLRNMSRFGKNVVLMRDMTDTMYDPRCYPYVSHYRGTELVVEHIEQHVCPTITSDQFIGGEPFVFKAARTPRIVIAIAEKEYKTKFSLPIFARTFLKDGRGYDVRVVYEDAKERDLITGFGSALSDADLVILSVRRRALPEKDLAAFRAYLQAGKPLVAIRTSCHAWDTHGKHPDGHAEWRTFDRDVLGGHYQGHHGGGPAVTITVAPQAKNHRIVQAIAAGKTPYTSKGSLYKTSPLVKTATPLLIGTIKGKQPEPVAWINTYGKSRVFYTSLGHPSDFANPRFVVMLAEAVEWALDKPSDTRPSTKR